MVSPERAVSIRDHWADGNDLQVQEPHAAGLDLGGLEWVPFLCGQLETMSTAASKLQRSKAEAASKQSQQLNQRRPELQAVA